MDAALNILTNLSPLILIIFAWIFIKLDDGKRCIRALRYIIFYALCIYFGVLPLLYSYGYGHTVFTCIVLLILIIGYIIIAYWLIEEDISLFNIIIAIICVYYVIFASVNVYSRLRAEGIIKIWFVDELLVKLSNLDYLKIIITVLENEWLKGIAIGVISAVIAGLILDRIKKNK